MGKEYPSLDRDIINLLVDNQRQAFNLTEIEAMLQSTYKKKYGIPIFDNACVLIALDRVLRKGTFARDYFVRARVVETKNGPVVYYRITYEPIIARPPVSRKNSG